jgi:hypothetical protein
MHGHQALQEIQRMHETETVRRESIIAWYRWYSQFPSNRLPRMYPERSDVDLIRTIALWMELTDRGGNPGFPYEYKCALGFPEINPTQLAKGSRGWVVGALAFLAGIVVVFFDWRIGLTIIIGGGVINYVSYKLAGGAANPDLMKVGSSLYETEGKRVLEWAARHGAGRTEDTELETRDMSLLSRLFGGGQSGIEHELQEMYAGMLCMLAGWTPKEAEQAVSEAIGMCKQQGKAGGTAHLPPDFGDRLIEAARTGEPKSKRIVEKAHGEGASEDDIREWWNLPDISRRMVLWSEDLFRYTVFLHARNDDGLSAEDAAARVHKMFPIYGDPEDASKLSGDNRPLPHEIRGRVDSYKQTYGAEYIAEQVRNFTSYNAFVRHAIAKGLI